MFIIVRTVFLFSLLMQPSTSNILEKTTVIVRNSLEGRQDLVLHCMSKDNDLGMQHLRFDQTFRWSFRVNFFETTLFHCTFQWQGASYKFVIYDARRDDPDCSQCSWIIKEQGPCFVFKHTSCLKWS